MLMKLLGKYVAMPAAGIGMLAGFGMLDLQPGTGGGGGGDLSSPAAAGHGVLQALEGPLEVARRIAAAGGAQMGLDPAALPDFLRTPGAAPVSGGAVAPAAPPPAGRKTVAVPQANAEGGGASAPLLGGGGAWKSSRPPAAAEGGS
jgi:hypothetical protein